jgi:hypothetical protein
MPKRLTTEVAAYDPATGLWYRTRLVPDTRAASYPSKAACDIAIREDRERDADAHSQAALEAGLATLARNDAAVRYASERPLVVKTARVFQNTPYAKRELRLAFAAEALGRASLASFSELSDDDLIRVEESLHAAMRLRHRAAAP